MIVKIIGAVLVTAGSAGFGLCLAGRLRERLALLEDLRKIIFLLKGEITYANAPLSEAFERVGKRGNAPWGQLFSQLSERIETQQGELFFAMWKEELGRLDRRLPLSAQDRRELESLGEHLGYLDRDMQERTILLYMESLNLTIDYLREHQKEQGRLYTSLGLMGGLFLTIVMC